MDATLPNTSSAPVAPLPEEWEEHYSEKRGHKYWFNRKTGESRWERPFLLSSQQQPQQHGFTTMDNSTGFDASGFVDTSMSYHNRNYHITHDQQKQYSYHQLSQQEVDCSTEAAEAAEAADTQQQQQQQALLTCVVDTNVILSHLEYLQELVMASPVQGVATVVLVPFIVLRELDGLKSRTARDGSGGGTYDSGSIATGDVTDVAVAARAAMRYLRQSFSAGVAGLRGQTLAEVNTEVGGLCLENNDDLILHCCLVAHQQVQTVDSRVVLLTNDHNLGVKALMCGIRALGAPEFPLNDAAILEVFASCPDSLTSDVIMTRAGSAMEVDSIAAVFSSSSSASAENRGGVASGGDSSAQKLDIVMSGTGITPMPPAHAGGDPWSSAIGAMPLGMPLLPPEKVTYVPPPADAPVPMNGLVFPSLGNDEEVLDHAGVVTTSAAIAAAPVTKNGSITTTSASASASPTTAATLSTTTTTRSTSAAAAAAAAAATTLAATHPASTAAEAMGKTATGGSGGNDYSGVTQLCICNKFPYLHPVHHD